MAQPLFSLPPPFLAFALGGSERLIADNAAKLVSTERKGEKEGEMEWERKWNERRKKEEDNFYFLGNHAHSSVPESSLTREICSLFRLLWN